MLAYLGENKSEFGGEGVVSVRSMMKTYVSWILATYVVTLISMSLTGLIVVWISYGITSGISTMIMYGFVTALISPLIIFPSGLVAVIVRFLLEPILRRLDSCKRSGIVVLIGIAVGWAILFVIDGVEPLGAGFAVVIVGPLAAAMGGLAAHTDTTFTDSKWWGGVFFSSIIVTAIILPIEIISS